MPRNGGTVIGTVFLCVLLIIGIHAMSITQTIRKNGWWEATVDFELDVYYKDTKLLQVNTDSLVVITNVYKIELICSGAQCFNY